MIVGRFRVRPFFATFTYALKYGVSAILDLRSAHVERSCRSRRSGNRRPSPFFFFLAAHGIAGLFVAGSMLSGICPEVEMVSDGIADRRGKQAHQLH